MNELIKTQENDNGEVLVNGRDLHEFLEVKDNYTDWFKRMIEYGFTEDIDFIGKIRESTGGRPSTDHHLKLNMAKEIAMIQRTDKGKEARLYFLELELAWNTPEKIFARALAIADKMMKIKDGTIRVQEQLISELKPLADYTDIILKNKGLVTITQISKDYGMSGFEMNQLLYGFKIQYKLGEQWLMYAKYQSCGYTHSETVNYKHSDGRSDIKMMTKWSQKGRLFIYKILRENDVIPLIEQELAV